MKKEILDFTYRPVADKKRAYAIFYILVSISAIVVILSVISQRYKGVISLCAVAVFVAAMVVYSRYLVGEYAYVVANCGEGNVLFIVTRTTGKRVSTLCNFSLLNIKSVRYGESAKLKAEKRENGVKLFNYCPSMSPDNMIVIEAAVGPERIRVYIEGSESLAARLTEDSRTAVLNRAEESENDGE